MQVAKTRDGTHQIAVQAPDLVGQVKEGFKIQGQFVSGGTTFSEYPHGGSTLSELAWRAHWTKLAILNQHTRGGITQYKKITQPLN